MNGPHIKKKLHRNIKAVGWASLVNDISSEMIYPLLPIFLTSVLGAPALALGVIEGLADTLSACMKWFSGVLTDHFHMRKPFIVAGYVLSGLVRPLMGITQTWQQVLQLRITDRLGKGVRASARDALITENVNANQRGKAFGFDRAMDHAGAALGPLIAAGLFYFFHWSIRKIFLCALIPAGIVFVILWIGIKEKKKTRTTKSTQPISFLKAAQFYGLGTTFKLFLVAVFIFTLGNSTDAFLILRLSNLGVSAAGIGLLWTCFHLIKMGTTYWGGKLSDTWNKKVMNGIGWLFYASVYFGFSWIDKTNSFITLFLIYGIYFGLTEPTERALVAEFSGENERGVAFGFYHAAVGIGTFPASLLFGWIYQVWGFSSAFKVGAGLAFVAAVILLIIPKSKIEVKKMHLSKIKN